MPQMVDREGNFRAVIAEYGLKEVKSGAIAVSIKCQLNEWFSLQENVWLPWHEYDMECEGDLWIVKKDGAINQPAVHSLIRHASWNGDLNSIFNCSWVPTPCQVTVKSDTYQNRQRFRIAFVNDHDRTPGAIGNVTEAKAKELQARFGAQLQALAGNAKRAAGPAPRSRPAAPSRPTQLVEPMPVNEPITSNSPLLTGESDIPF